MSVINKTILSVILLLACQFSKAAEKVEALKPFTSACTEEQSTGYNWENNKWKQTNFYIDKKVIKKIPPNEMSENFLCQPEDVMTSGNITFIKACYNIRAREREYSISDSLMCAEKYENGKLLHIYCDGVFETLKFRPNGNFISTRMNSSLESAPAKNYKDSISISVGLCSSIN